MASVHLEIIADDFWTAQMNYTKAREAITKSGMEEEFQDYLIYEDQRCKFFGRFVDK